MNIFETIHSFFRHRLSNPSARGEKESFIKSLRSEYEWTKVRNAYFKLHPLCEVCQYHKEGQVHHVQPWHLFEALRFDMNNLITLCQPCHFRFGHGRNWKKWNPEIRELSSEVQLRMDDIRTDASEI